MLPVGLVVGRRRVLSGGRHPPPPECGTLTLLAHDLFLLRGLWLGAARSSRPPSVCAVEVRTTYPEHCNRQLRFRAGFLGRSLEACSSRRRRRSWLRSGTLLIWALDFARRSKHECVLERMRTRCFRCRGSREVHMWSRHAAAHHLGERLRRRAAHHVGPTSWGSFALRALAHPSPSFLRAPPSPDINSPSPLVQHISASRMICVHWHKRVGSH